MYDLNVAHDFKKSRMMQIELFFIVPRLAPENNLQNRKKQIRNNDID
jgi:hypothetical protein